MKTGSEKSATTTPSTATQAAKQPFMPKAAGNGFFEPNTSVRKNGNAGEATKTTKGSAGSPPPNHVTSLKSALFSPTPLIAQYIEEGKKAGVSIKVSFGSFASGEITVRKTKDYYETRGVATLPMVIPLLRPLQEAGIPLALAIEINKNQIEGYVSVAGKGGLSKNGFLKAIQEHTQVLGWKGIHFNKLPGSPKNAITGGVLMFGLDDLPVRLGGFLDSKFSIGLTDDRFTFAGSGTAKIPGLQPTVFSLALRPDGKIAGAVSTGVTFKNFNGAVQIRFLNGLVDGKGDVQYTTEKLSGIFHILLTDEKTARGIAFGLLPPEQLNQTAINQSGLQPSGETAEPQPGPRALAGSGNLTFAFNEWLTGTALVVVDGAGHVTVMSEITPQKEFTLFKPRHFPAAGPKRLFSFKPTFRFGIPYVADIHVGINISLDASATLGPALLRNITAKGTYSTDPLIFNQFALSADLYIQAQAALVLALDAKAGLGILGHDIDVGAGISGALVLKAYVLGQPTIGYREKADPIQGKKGEFYIQGSAVAVAQPFFILKGYVFVELDSPWISPAPDKRWEWPLGKKEYPLGSGWGIGMDIGGKEGYVLGSGIAPDINFSDAKFDGSQFIDNVANDNVANEQARKSDSRNDFSDKIKGQAPPPPPPAPAIDIAADSKKGKKQKVPTDEKLTEKWMNAAKNGLEPLKQKADKKPFDQGTLTSELNKLRSKFGFTAIQATASGDNWMVIAEMFDRNNKRNPLGLKGAPKTEGIQEDKAIKGETVPGQEGMSDQVRAGLAALEQVTQGYAKQGATEDEMTTALKSVRRKFAFKSIQLLEKGGYWHYLYEINPKGDLTGPKVMAPALVADGAAGKTIIIEGTFVLNLTTNKVEKIIASSAHNKPEKRPQSSIPIGSFVTRTDEGKANTYQLSEENTKWKLSTFRHSSNYVTSDGSLAHRFILKAMYVGGEKIRSIFYQDPSTRPDLSSRKTAAQQGAPAGMFFSEAPAQEEAAFKYPIDPARGKAVIPLDNYSEDHQPPVARHWSHLGGNGQIQKDRVNWNSLTNYTLMSNNLNSSKGSGGVLYTKEVQESFRGPGEK